MEVDIGLTEQGEKEYMKVIESVYAFINDIKTLGIKDYVFDELKNKNLMDFNNAPKQAPLETAVDLSRKMNANLNQSDIAEINRKPFLFEHINKDDIMNRLNLMKADNMYAIFHSKNHKKEKDANPSLF
jgi:secreted Zn-dependent insulinase-like peptidase